jgi:hypothetical protein
MRFRMVLHAAALGSMLLGPVLAAGATEEAEVAAIRALYAEVNEAIAAGHAEETVFVAVGEEYRARRWRRVAAGAKLPAADDAYVFVATVHRIGGVVRKLRIVTDTPSGDWQNVVEYWFRAGGRPAFRLERHSTFLSALELEGPFVVERRSYFSDAGRKIRERERAFVKRTGKDVPVREIQHIDTDVFLSAAEVGLAPAR